MKISIKELSPLVKMPRMFSIHMEVASKFSISQWMIRAQWCRRKAITSLLETPTSLKFHLYWANLKPNLELTFNWAARIMLRTRISIHQLHLQWLPAEEVSTSLHPNEASKFQLLQHSHIILKPLKLAILLMGITHFNFKKCFSFWKYHLEFVLRAEMNLLKSWKLKWSYMPKLPNHRSSTWL